MKAEIAELIEVLRKHRPKDHGMWSKDEFLCADTRIEKLRMLRNKGVINFTPEDLDNLIFKSKSTIGSNETFQFFLTDFFEVSLANPESSFVCDADMLRRKMDYCQFEEWDPKAKNIALKLVQLLNQLEEKFEYEG